MGKEDVTVKKDETKSERWWSKGGLINFLTVGDPFNFFIKASGFVICVCFQVKVLMLCRFGQWREKDSKGPNALTWLHPIGWTFPSLPIYAYRDAGGVA